MVPGAEASGFVAPRRALEKSIMLEIWLRGEFGRSDLMGPPGGKGGGKHTPACLHRVTTFPDHGTDGSAEHI